MIGLPNPITNIASDLL